MAPRRISWTVYNLIFCLYTRDGLSWRCTAHQLSCLPIQSINICLSTNVRTMFIFQGQPTHEHTVRVRYNRIFILSSLLARRSRNCRRGMRGAHEKCPIYSSVHNTGCQVSWLIQCPSVHQILHRAIPGIGLLQFDDDLYKAPPTQERALINMYPYTRAS